MRYLKGRIVVLGIVVVIAGVTGSASSQSAVPILINYQGELRSPTTGEPIPDGSYEMLFRIYDVESGGTPLWEEVHSSLYDAAVEVTNGIFNVVLGSGTGDALSASIFDGSERWLAIRVETETLAPRQRMTSVAYSIVSENSRLLDGKGATDFADAAHTHSGGEITSGVVSEERVDSLIARDSEVNGDIAAHAAVANAHHAKTTSFADLTDTATDAQIPDDITITYAASAGDADTLDGTEAADLEESAEIEAALTGHAAIADAHHPKTTSFMELTDSASDSQIPDPVARDAEVDSRIVAHASIADAHHAKTTSFTDLTDAASEGQIPDSIARDSEIVSVVLAGDGTGSTLDADLLDGTDSAGFAPAAHTHDAADLSSGTVNDDRFSAYGDLTAEGYLDNNADDDVLTRSQNDGRYWKLSGNSGALGFVGTTDLRPLELRVSSQRALRIEPVDVLALSPNIIAGCYDNSVTSGVKGATIGGGGSPSVVPPLPDYSNSVDDNYGTVAGGFNNHAGDGAGSIVDSAYATVGGGAHNQATGLSSTIPGGWANTAAGQYSFAAGRRAKIAADHNGTVLFADGLDYDFNSSAANEFAVRATGGARFVSQVDTGNPTAGVVLKPGDSQWQSLSDRAVKENLAAVDGTTALAQLMAVPIRTWNYKAQDASIRHMGPMAQDFYAAFGLGDDDRYIGTLDANGVALAAIQGLHEVVQEKEVRISTLEQRNAELEARLAALEALVKNLTEDEPRDEQ